MDFHAIVQRLQVGDALGFQCLACRIGWIQTPVGPAPCVVCNGTGCLLDAIRVQETVIEQSPPPEKHACPPCIRCEGRGWVRAEPRAPEERTRIYELWPTRIYRTSDGVFTVGFIHLGGRRAGTPPRMRTVKVEGSGPYPILSRA